MYYSKFDRMIRKFVPSVAKISYNPFVKIASDAVSGALSLPFPELWDLPPNHLRIRIGTGNRVLNNHIDFVETGSRVWLRFFSRRYCTFRSDVVEFGCGCGRIARPLKGDWFEGTYLGVDIDTEMISYCRRNFPEARFKFVVSPHQSVTYSPYMSYEREATPGLVIAEPDTKDFVYSHSLYSHLLENELTEYMHETYRILRTDGIMYMTFFCKEHVELGQRWTFGHRRDNAYVESAQYPEAAVAYHEAFIVELARNCGFREITVAPGTPQSVLVARK
jgi:SAM-dependent methyltransferase